MIPIQKRITPPSEAIRQALKQFGCKLRVSMPAIVVSFDEDAQTVVVQPAVTELIRQNAVPTVVTLPQIADVPISLPSAGGWDLTLPIQAGDECELVFSDMAFDFWWQNGGVANQPAGKLFRHDLFDAVAIFGLRSQPRRLENYSTTSAQLRNEDQSVVLDLADDAMTLTAPAVNIVAAASSAKASGGTATPLVTEAFTMWFVTNVVPYLAAHGYTGPPPPAGIITTTFEAE
jgi:hypothetical protein